LLDPTAAVHSPSTADFAPKHEASSVDQLAIDIDAKIWHITKAIGAIELPVSAPGAGVAAFLKIEKITIAVVL